MVFKRWMDAKYVAVIWNFYKQVIYDRLENIKWSWGY